MLATWYLDEFKFVHLFESKTEMLATCEFSRTFRFGNRSRETELRFRFFRNFTEARNEF